MNSNVNYVVVTPVRNEGSRFDQTIASMRKQSCQPRRWIIVDDGSTDDTRAQADQAAQECPWIGVVHRADRGFRKQGGGVIEAFYDGYRLVADEGWDFIAKMDGDLSFDSNYFVGCLNRFLTEPKLGIGGGRVYHRQNRYLVDDSPGDPAFHVRGATKIYRRATWEAIGGLVRAPGWDTLDELKANMLGWKTASFPDLPVIQLKPTGYADGAWRNWFKNGRANYVTGYHPLFMLAKCLKRAGCPPIGIGAFGLFCGFVSGYLRRVPQVADAELIRYLRRQQLNRLLLRKSLWN